MVAILNRAKQSKEAGKEEQEKEKQGDTKENEGENGKLEMEPKEEVVEAKKEKVKCQLLTIFQTSFVDILVYHEGRARSVREWSTLCSS